jgi:hypothetical protein
MDLVDLSKLSSADALELVARLHHANEQLQGTPSPSHASRSLCRSRWNRRRPVRLGRCRPSGSSSRCSIRMKTWRRWCINRAPIFLAWTAGVLFLLDDNGMLTVVTPDTAPSLEPLALEHIGELARRALDARSLISAPGKAGAYPSCIALPLSRMGQDVGSGSVVPRRSGRTGAVGGNVGESDHLRRDTGRDLRWYASGGSAPSRCAPARKPPRRTRPSGAEQSRHSARCV